MNFFQFLDTYPWITVAAFAVIQLVFFNFTFFKLNELNFFFPSKKWETTDGEDGLTLIAEPEDSQHAQELVREINDYIKKTNGAVEYAVIKDKTERRIDSLYEFATSKISFPTYLGLMGTFFGVYIGLKCFNAGLGQGNGGITDQMVKELIGGIIVSMVTSLVGLVLMTISNIHASNVQKKVDAQKDEFFEFLQMSVIPTLGTNVSSSLNRLRSTIGKFEPSFRAVIEEFKTEEFGKMVPLLIINRKSKEPLYPRTLVFYGLMSGIAFGVFEGVQYQVTFNTQLDYTSAFYSNIARLTSLPFLHAIWCAIAGYFVAFANLYPKYRRSLYFLALAIPALQQITVRCKKQ